MLKPSLVLAFALSLLYSPVCMAETLSHEDFTAQFSPLVGGAEHADLMLNLCDKALHDVSDKAYIATAHAYKSHAYWLKKDFAKAEAEAREAVKADPNSPLAHFMLTDVLYELHQFDAARTSCLEAADHVPNPAHQTELKSLCESSYEYRKTNDPTKLTTPKAE